MIKTTPEDDYAIEKAVGFLCELMSKMNYSTHPDSITSEHRDEYHKIQGILNDEGYECIITQRPFDSKGDDKQYYLIRVNRKVFNNQSIEIYSEDYTMTQMKKIKLDNSLNKLID